MVEDHDSERLTDVVEAVSPRDRDDDPLGMRIGPGTDVGGYIIDGKLGHGGMGVVYSATHPVIGKRAAIKILRPEVSRSPIAVERFIQEARAVNQIGHPNIIDIFAYGALPDGRAYHIMDLLVGESLRRRLKRSVLHPSEAASVIDEIAQALAAAHDHGFVHRDLKPDNVFLVHHEGRWPEVKLLDFGLAKLMPERGIAAFTTKTGVMLGTPEYMSPEQARGEGVDYHTDIYALGIVMFEILAGHRPFPTLGDSLATLMQHAEEPPLSLADMVPGLPQEMIQLVDAMLAKTPEARPSLAAVRTVIKRLRTTQLPSRSVAGLELPPLPISANPAHGIAAARLRAEAARFGAEAMLPGDSQPLDRPGVISQPQTTTPGVGIESLRGTNPSLQASFGGVRSAPGLEPGDPRAPVTANLRGEARRPQDAANPGARPDRHESLLSSARTGGWREPSNPGVRPDWNEPSNPGVRPDWNEPSNPGVRPDWNEPSNPGARPDAWRGSSMTGARPDALRGSSMTGARPDALREPSMTGARPDALREPSNPGARGDSLRDGSWSADPASGKLPGPVAGPASHPGASRAMLPGHGGAPDEALRAAPVGSQPLETSGLRAKSKSLPPTKLGVGPPPRSPALPAPRVVSLRRVWLVLAILLVIGAGIALAIAWLGM